MNVHILGSMKRSLQLTAVLAVMVASAAPAADLFVFFGTHRSGTNAGFSLAHFDTGTGELTRPELLLSADSPAFFEIHPDGRHLYTCNSGKPGAVSAYEIEPHTGQLTFLNREPAGGDDTCHLSLDRTAHFALTANYGSGNIAVFALKPDGRLGERTAFVQHTGSSIDPRRQTHAYAHSIVTDPGNQFALVADLGLDKIFVYRFNARTGSLKPNHPPFARVALGSGPRHLKFHPNGRWVYVINEIASTITGFNWNAGAGTLGEIQTTPTVPADFTGANTAAEIVVHPNGKFLYASNRGHDSLAVFAVDQKTGWLKLVEHVSCGGKTPRYFSFDPTGRWILCANHGSDSAVVFQADENTGRLTQTGAPVPAPYPFCISFLPVR